MNDATVIVLFQGNFEYIGIRDRASQTLYISELLHLQYLREPAYGKLESALHTFTVRETIDRWLQETLERMEKKRKRGDGPGGGGSGGGGNDDDQGGGPDKGNRDGHDGDDFSGGKKPKTNNSASKKSGGETTKTRAAGKVTKHTATEVSND
jgi:hypothetical protein